MATYAQLVKQAEKQRIRITNQQRIQIANIFAESANDIGKNLSYKISIGDDVKRDYVIDYARELKRNSKYIFDDVKQSIISGNLNTARCVTDAQSNFWGNINPALQQRVQDSMSKIPQAVVNEIVSGGLYKDGNGLSSRIWRQKKTYEHDIDYIIERGIIEKKSALELAQDLQQYVKPGAQKSFDWKTCYPNAQEKVDYNAQRLARTSNTHAYQMAFQRSTRDNPFITQYQWHSSNSGRVCPLCAEMDGKMFDKDDVPLDHPNGMCVITAIIEKDYDEIADEIADYVNGGSNPDLDNWLT